MHAAHVRCTVNARVNEFHVRAWHPVDACLAFSSGAQRAWPRGRELQRERTCPTHASQRISINTQTLENAHLLAVAARARVRRVMRARKNVSSSALIKAARGSRGSERFFFHALAHAHAWVPACSKNQAIIRMKWIWELQFNRSLNFYFILNRWIARYSK